MKKIKEVVINFINAGDSRNINILEDILHSKFQNIQDGFFEKQGIHIFNKENYIELIKNKIFGGSKRSVEFITIEQLKNISIVRVNLESEFLKFKSVIMCVYENDKWKIINNIPTIEKK